MQRWWAIVAPLMLAGCATSGPTGDEVITGSVRPETARLVIYRQSALGFAVQPSYLVDGKAVANSQPQGFVVCSLRPGRHRIGVDNFALNVNIGGGSDKTDLDLKPGTTTYVKAEPSMGLTVGVVTLSNVTDAQGRSDVSGLHKIESNCAA